MFIKRRDDYQIFPAGWKLKTFYSTFLSGNNLLFLYLECITILWIQVVIDRCIHSEGFPDSSVGKESACSEGDLGSIPGLGRSPGKRKGYPLLYSGLENSTDRGAWLLSLYICMCLSLYICNVSISISSIKWLKRFIFYIMLKIK